MRLVSVSMLHMCACLCVCVCASSMCFEGMSSHHRANLINTAMIYYLCTVMTRARSLLLRYRY